MHSTKSAKRYAQALVSLAIEKGELDRVKDDVSSLMQVLDDSRDFRTLMESPVIRADKKKEIVRELFGSKLSQLTLKFVELLIQKGRENVLLPITESFIDLWRKEKGIVEVEIHSAQPLTEAQRDTLIKKVKPEGSSEIELVEVVDKSMVGGFVLRMKDKQIDASLRSRLRALKSDFDKNLYVPEI
jgi:F-type H+-transporting ATPase subunit delta